MLPESLLQEGQEAINLFEHSLIKLVRYNFYGIKLKFNFAQGGGPTTGQTRCVLQSFPLMQSTPMHWIVLIPPRDPCLWAGLVRNYSFIQSMPLHWIILIPLM